jgi:hypothetical protein
MKLFKQQIRQGLRRLLGYASGRRVAHGVFEGDCMKDNAILIGNLDAVVEWHGIHGLENPYNDFSRFEDACPTGFIRTR